MRPSRRARRMERRRSRVHRNHGLNLTSMTDFFTMLVTFLLVNSLSVQVLPSPRAMTLPESTARENLRHEVVVVMLTHDQILVNGQPVIGYDQVLASDRETIPALTAALLRQAQALDKSRATSGQAGEPPQDAAAAPAGRGLVTIMADKSLPYRLIRKVMLTSTEAQFARISLAVLQKSQG